MGLTICFFEIKVILGLNWFAIIFEGMRPMKTRISSRFAIFIMTILVPAVTSVAAQTTRDIDPNLIRLQWRVAAVTYVTAISLMILRHIHCLDGEKRQLSPVL